MVFLQLTLCWNVKNPGHIDISTNYLKTQYDDTTNITTSLELNIEFVSCLYDLFFFLWVECWMLLLFYFTGRAQKWHSFNTVLSDDDAGVELQEHFICVIRILCMDSNNNKKAYKLNWKIKKLKSKNCGNSSTIVNIIVTHTTISDYICTSVVSVNMLELYRIQRT